MEDAVAEAPRVRVDRVEASRLVVAGLNAGDAFSLHDWESESDDGKERTSSSSSAAAPSNEEYEPSLKVRPWRRESVDRGGASICEGTEA